ncbi:MAG: helix-turn-helix domain-containing protein [Bacillota bacterium]
MNIFPKRLKELRTKNDISQEELGLIVNLSKSTISLYESGKREPDYETLKKLADYFGCSTDYLLGKTNIKNAINQSPTVEEQIMAILYMDEDFTEEEKKLLAEDIADYLEYRKAKLRGTRN